MTKSLNFQKSSKLKHTASTNKHLVVISLKRSLDKQVDINGMLGIMRKENQRKKLLMSSLNLFRISLKRSLNYLRNLKMKLRP
jgi:hypothetical protein